MKKNIKRTMDKLNIDYPIRGLIKQLWKRNYKTIFSCSGHINGCRKYLAFIKGYGDGWFERNNGNYGFEKVTNSFCCSETLKRVSYASFCAKCGGGLNKIITYEGKSVLLLK